MAVLAGAIVALDVLWSALVGSTGRLAYGFLDGPAHMATCAVALIAIAAARRGPLPASFAIAALIASVAIDLDHLPGYLGSDLLGGDLPRPVTHSLLPVGACLVLAAAPSRRLRPIALGVATGLLVHLWRDMATGPGVPLAWPLSSASVTLPYATFAATLALVVAGPAVAVRLAQRQLWPGFGIVLGIALAIAPAVPAHALGPAIAPRVSLGAYMPGVDRDPAKIETYAREVGRRPLIVSIYKNWGNPVFQPAQLTGIWDRGAVPMITWEPQDEAEVGASLWSIANGQYDSYIDAEAREAAAWGQPVFVRFAHEMNGDWYPWGQGVEDHTPAAFKLAWRHVVAIFRSEGATNVRWVWCPYARNSDPGQFRRFYPGDRWVDWAGLDGFNWGGHAVWQSFEQIFAEPYRLVSRVSSRPIMIGEIGAAQGEGNKARWISRSFGGSLRRYPRVRALVWFDSADDRANFRVDSSAASLSAIRHVFDDRLFSSSRRMLLSTPARMGPVDRRSWRQRR